MKKITLLLLVVLIASASSFAGTKPINILKATDAFVLLKFDKRMVGGTIEVFNEKGERIATVNVDHRKMLLDFYNEPDGNYEIRIKKNDVTLNFSLHIQSPGSEASNLDAITCRLDVY